MKCQLDSTQLPYPLTMLIRDVTISKARAVVALGGFELFGTYVTERRPSTRIKRALCLHSVLAASGENRDVADLTIEYHARVPDDPCSARDCEIAMDSLGHLFVEVTEGNWSALGSPADAPFQGAARGNESSVAKSAPDRRSSSPERTVRESIIAELRNEGPLRISQLLIRASDFLPKGRSANSVGPVLITNKDIFRRLLPGLYGLHDQVPSSIDLLTAPPPYLFNEDHARLYAFARRAGEPWGVYPLWIPETEYVWCVWARRHAYPDLLQSLLSIADIDSWPDLVNKQEWRAFAANRRSFPIHFPPNPESLILPTLDHVLAACLHIRQHHHLGWISGNRILRRRAGEHLSAGLLATLVALRILAPDATHWQLPHLPGPRLNQTFDELQPERLQRNVLSWQSPLGRILAEQAVNRIHNSGWVTTDVVGATFDHITSPLPTLTPLEQLLAERDALLRTTDRVRTVRELLA